MSFSTAEYEIKDWSNIQGMMKGNKEPKKHFINININFSSYLIFNFQYLPRDVQLGTSCTNHRRLWGWLDSSFMARQSSGTWKQRMSKIFQKAQWNQTSNRSSTSFLALTEALWQKDHSFLEIAQGLEPAKTYTVHRFNFILNSGTEQIHLSEFH